VIIRTLAGSLAALAAAPALATQSPPPVDTYRLAPVVENGKVVSLSVTLTLPANADGRTRLRLPSDWGGGETLWRFVKDLTVEGGEVSAPSDDVRLVTSRPGARLTVRYRVISAYDDEPPLQSPNYAQPIIGPDGFYVTGPTIFVRPEARKGDRVRFVWDPKGSGLVFASDLEEMIHEPGTLDAIEESVALAGKDVRILTRDAGGAPLRLAVKGRFDFTDAAFADMAAGAIDASRAFWGDGREPFLITLASQSAPEGHISRRGSGFHNAFAIISTTHTPLAEYRLFLAHEYFHTWNSNRLGSLKDGPDEPTGYWFSEGFTDYYARRLSLRSGFIDLEAFVAAWNEALKAYGLSPARTAPNAEIAVRFWHENAFRRLPYFRGALIAVLMENRLKAKGGLDPVMLAMRDHAKDRDPATWDHAAANLFPRIALARTGIDVTPELDRYANKGEAVVLPPDAFGGCLTVETVTRPVFDRGFDADTSLKSGVITGVAPDGAAHAAGLRDGMKRLGREGGLDGDSTVEIGYVVSDAAGKRTIRYRPEGKARETFQRIVMPGDLTPEARAACVKAVAG
jgi:predicted metalloprotease with PDZ domain